jgi:hypothetical protein
LSWSLGWLVTTMAGVSVDEQFIVFGASGAIVYSALSGVALVVVHRPVAGIAGAASAPAAALG